MKISLIAILICTAFTTLLQAQLAVELTDYADFLRNKIIIEYKNADHNFSAIDRQNMPYVDCLNPCQAKTKTISYYLHGYMGSPYEMKFIADAALTKGDIVFNDLIIGYGANAQIANHFKWQLWYKHTEQNLNFIFKNADLVNLTGFSTGGLLISKYIQDHPENLQKIKNVHLVSPFYFPHFSFTPFVGKILNFFTNTINVDWFYKLSSFPDVEVITLEPKYYLNDVPTHAALEVAEMARDFREKAHPIANISMHVYLSQQDQVLSYDKTLPFLKSIYPQGNFILYNNGKYPHHLMSPIVSNAAIEIKNRQ